MANMGVADVTYTMNQVRRGMQAPGRFVNKVSLTFPNGANTGYPAGGIPLSAQNFGMPNQQLEDLLTINAISATSYSWQYDAPNNKLRGFAAAPGGTLGRQTGLVSGNTAATETLLGSPIALPAAVPATGTIVRITASGVTLGNADADKVLRIRCGAAGSVLTGFSLTGSLTFPASIVFNWRLVADLVVTAAATQVCYGVMSAALIATGATPAVFPFNITGGTQTNNALNIQPTGIGTTASDVVLNEFAVETIGLGSASGAEIATATVIASTTITCEAMGF